MSLFAKFRDNKSNGPEDAIVSKIFKKLSMEKINSIAMCFGCCSWAKWNLETPGKL